MSDSYKIVFCGESGVGKTTLIDRLLYDTFNSDDHRPTIGTNCAGSLNWSRDGRTFKLNFEDTAGQESYRSFCPISFRTASIIIICYMPNDEYLNDVKEWKKIINETQATKPQKIILVSTQYDKYPDSNQILQSFQDEYSQSFFSYVYTSSLSGIGREALLDAICDAIITIENEQLATKSSEVVPKMIQKNPSDACQC